MVHTRPPRPALDLAPFGAVPSAEQLFDLAADGFGIDVAGDTVVVMSAIDNLVKGAAGGAVQWMNRLWGLPETTGLLAPAPAWT